MTTSTNEPPELDTDTLSPDEQGGALADALTFLRIIVTPVIMALVVWRWPDTQIAILATTLFIIAALTDIFDDFFGGAARGAHRRYGYLDDAADTILFVGVLIAIAVVLFGNGLVSWTWLVPVAVLVLREVGVGVLKGFELSRYGWPDNLWSNMKGGFAMLGTALLLSSPWLTQWIDMSRATPETVVDVYNSASPLVWILGEIALWIAAVFALISGWKILTSARPTDADAEVADLD